MVERLGGFTGGDVEIEGDNWMFCEVLVGDRGGFGEGVIVFCKLEEPGVRVVQVLILKVFVWWYVFLNCKVLLVICALPS